MEKIPPPPQAVQEAYRKGVANFCCRSDAAREKFLNNSANVGVPYLTLTLKNVLEGVDAVSNDASGVTDWKNAQPSGWRLVIDDPDGTKALAEVNSAGRMVSFSMDPEVAAFHAAFKQIQQAEQLKPGKDYTLKLLRIPAAKVEAFWLRSPDGTDNILVPIQIPSALKKRQFDLDDFLKALQPLARKFLEFDRKKA